MNTKEFMGKHNFEEYETGGYMMYRIPGIVVTNKGTVLAHYEARMGKGDWTKQDVILRRSTDNGENWSDRIKLVEGDSEETIHNACMIVENETDIIHFLWHKNYNQCFYQKSIDDGLSWTEPVEITYVFEEFRKEYDWNVIAVGPGHGIQLENGRLLIPAWLSTGGKRHRPSVLSTIYSDDGGESWERGEIIWNSEDFINPNETVAVELENGNVLLNIRHESPVPYRAVAISSDGATYWTTPVYDKELPDPVCFGSIQRFTKEEDTGFSAILFSNCAFKDEKGRKAKAEGKVNHWSREARRNLTIRLSLDECNSWEYARLLEEKAGYSDLAVSKDKKTIFYLYEREWVDGVCTNTKHMAVARFNIEWVTEGEVSI